MPVPDSADDEAARFEAEALPHARDLYRMAYRMTGEASRAEDAVQDTYFEAWKSFHRFEPGTHCRAWLYRILFHCVQHQRRRLLRFPLLRAEEEFREENLPAPVDVPDVLGDKDILAALDSLSAEFRAVVILADVEEFAYREIAAILEIPIGTVMSRLSRGRKQLRDSLQEVARQYGIGARARKEAAHD